MEAGLLLANFFARAGQANRAQAFVDAWAETRGKEGPHVEYDHVQALLAIALGNPMSAIARLRKLHTDPNRCGVHANFDLAIAYEALAERDSAIAAFERHQAREILIIRVVVGERRVICGACYFAWQPCCQRPWW